MFDSYKLKNFKVVTAPVPESVTWMMMIAGFGVVGATMRRKTLTGRAVANRCLGGPSRRHCGLD